MSPDEGVLESTVLKSQDEPTILRFLRLNQGDARHPFAQLAENRAEQGGVLLAEKSRDQGEVLPSRGQVLGLTAFVAWPRLSDAEIGDVLRLNHSPEGGDDLEALKLPKPLDRENVRRPERLNLALIGRARLAVVRLVRDGNALPMPKV